MLEVKHIKNIMYAVDDADIIHKQEIGDCVFYK